MKLIVSHLTRPKKGELVNGDAVVVRLDEKQGLLAVIDALGHGPHAAEAAARAIQYLESVPLAHEVREIIGGLHETLRDTRGAAAMVCCLRRVDAGVVALSGCGVGNVELRASSSGVPAVLSPGVLGGSVRQMRVFHGKLHPKSRLVLFSDGISARFSLDSLRLLPPTEACSRLMSENGRVHDDATVLIADCGE